MTTKPKTYRQYQTRGRFYVEPSENIDRGYMVIDDLDGTLIDFERRWEAEEAAKFFRAYVKKWGDVDLTTAPDSFDSPLTYEDAQGERPWRTLPSAKERRAGLGYDS